MSEVGCHNCIGACCTRLMELPLTLQESQLLEQAGTPLKVLLRAELDQNWNDILQNTTADTPYDEHLKEVAKSLPTGTGLYQLLANCAFLDTGQDGMAKCTIFDNPERPSVCSDFQANSVTCRRVRLTRGIWDY